MAKDQSLRHPGIALPAGRPCAGKAAAGLRTVGPAGKMQDIAASRRIKK